MQQFIEDVTFKIVFRLILNMKSLLLCKNASRCRLYRKSISLFLRNVSSSESDEKGIDEIALELLGIQQKEKIDPSETNALLFPGQGSQYVGMAKNLLQYPNVKEMFDCASETIGYNLLDVCLTGPKKELDKTIHSQPAVFVTSLAAVEKLQVDSPEVLENSFMTAGYSVGEYAALVFAGALTFEDAIRLVHARADEMQKASDRVASGMVSIVGGARTKFNSACSEAIEYCEENLGLEDVVCKVSGYLAPNFRTVAGHRAALEYLQSRKQDYYMKRVQFLPVSGAFHTVLMQSAKTKLRNLLKHTEIANPIIKVYSNIDGKPYRGPNDILNKLPDQIVKPVHWEQTMHHIFSRDTKESMPNVYELGPGKQLGTLLRKCNGKAWTNYLTVDIEQPE